MTPLKLRNLRTAFIALLLFSGAAICGAATVTVGPTGMYTDPCVAFAHLVDGDTVTIDANGGTPYYETLAEGSGGSGGTCIIKNNNLTISGINGRPIIDGSQAGVVKGVWIINGHDNVINNIEFRNATNSADDTSADAIRVQAGTASTPNGGNITIENSYIVGNDQGFLTAESGVNPKTGVNVGEWYSSSPYITFQYDEFAYNGISAQEVANDGGEPGHNFYLGHDWNEKETFTLQYSWTHDCLYGHDVRDRAPISNISYNMISDTWGYSSFMIDVPNGGSTYIVGNVIYKTQVVNWETSEANSVVFMAYRESSSHSGDPGVYSLQDMHFVNNTVIDDSEAGSNSDVAFMYEECNSGVGVSDQTQCPTPLWGDQPLTVKGVFENNIFIGWPTLMTNDLAAYTAGNVNLLNTEPTDANMAALHFANPDALDFHITSGSSAIGMGIYPPTDNTGATDMKAYAQYQYAPPALQGAARPTPGGSTMDAGAFSYPPPSAPSLSLNISPSTISIPGTGTITVSGLPTPPAGTFNYATPISGNTSVVTAQSGASSTTSVVMPYQTIPGIGSTTVVPVNVYADGGIVSGNITVNPGPPVPYSITLDDTNSPYLAGTTVHLEGPAGTGGQVVNLSSSDSTIVSVPSTVTVPEGQISAETGSLIGSEWGASPTYKSATITATVGTTSAQGTFNFRDLRLTTFRCVTTPSCASVQGGNTYQVYETMIGSAPAGGSTVQITSSNPAVVPNQSYTVAQGTNGPSNNKFEITTNTVTSNQTVTISGSLNGALLTTGSITVTPGNPATSIVVHTGNNQSAAVGTEFTDDLNALVTDASGNPVAGVSVTISPGPGVTIIYSGGSGSCTPPLTITGGAGQICFDAEPTASGPLTVSVSAAGVSTPAVFNLTGTGGATPASIAAYSGSGQSSNVGTAFSSPLVAIVKDSSSNPVSGATVTFSGTGLSFSPSSAVTNSSGLASTTATPTATGSLTADASVSGVGTPATFAETGTAAVAVSSITRDTTYGAGTTVHLTAAAPAGGAVVTLSSSDSTVGYIPASVTVPAGQTSAEDGSFLGSLWGPSPTHKSVTFTATYNGTAQITLSLASPGLLNFNCPGNNCTVTGGDTISMTTSITPAKAPYGGATETITSSNTAVIPNQSLAYNAGQSQSVDGPTMPLVTNAVSTTTSVTVTAAFNGSQITRTFTVNP